MKRINISFFVCLMLVLPFCSCAMARQSSAPVVQNIVTDGSDYLSKVLNGLTPEMFGAKGDGKVDDTDALREALFQSNKLGRLLYFPSGNKYYVTGPLNYYAGKFHDYNLNIMGTIPIRQTNTFEEYGGIVIADKVALFKNATFSGSIQNLAVTTKKRSLDTHFFDNCVCRGFVMSGCAVMNFGAMFYDTSIKQLSQIVSNSFWSVYYFARNVKTSSGCIDSSVSLNYINGGQEVKDNVCFEWAFYNGAMVTNNFVDYYRIVYCPKAISKQEFVGPISTGNQYQVFRYFFSAGDNITYMTMNSYADAFNWNNPDKLEHLSMYPALTYKGKDGKTYDIPPYVAICNDKWKVSIKSATIEGNMKSLVFINSSLSQYQFSYFDVEFIGNDPYAEGQIYWREDTKSLYNGGSFLQKRMNIDGIVEKVDKVPEYNINWTSSIPGRKVLYNNKIYTATNVKEAGRWVAKWLDEQGQEYKND